MDMTRVTMSSVTDDLDASGSSAIKISPHKAHKVQGGNTTWGITLLLSLLSLYNPSPLSPWLPLRLARLFSSRRAQKLIRQHHRSPLQTFVFNLIHPISSSLLDHLSHLSRSHFTLLYPP